MSADESHSKVNCETREDAAAASEKCEASEQINDIEAHSTSAVDTHSTSMEVGSTNCSSQFMSNGCCSETFSECSAAAGGQSELQDMDLSTPRDSSDGAGCAAAVEGGGDKEMVEFKVIYNKQTFNVVFPLDSTVLSLKEHVQQLTDVEVKNQKIMFKGLMKDELTLGESKLTNGAKVMVVGSKTTDIQSVNQTVPVSKEDKSSTSSVKEPLCRQKPHQAVLDKYGKPEDVMPGIKKTKEPLPPVPLSGMYNKNGNKVRLTFKLEADQVWIGTKERTEKVALNSIKAIVNEPIEGHEEYHLLGLQLGPTEASRYWIYWVPAQYVDSIKDTILGNWQYM